MDGSCKAYGESLLHSKKQVEHERLRLAKTVGRLTNSYKGTYKRRQTHRFCSCIDGPLKAPPLTLFHYMRTRPVVNNCIPTPFLAFQPWPVERYQTLLSACAYALARALIFHEGSGHQTNNGFVSKIAIAFPYLRAHCSRPFLYVKRAHFRIPSVYYARDCTRAVNLYAHV